MDYLQTKDNIVALATPDGVGSISVIRISGKSLLSLYKALTRRKKFQKSHTIKLMKIYSPKSMDKKYLDKCLVSFFKSENSFCGDDVVEINCHGGTYIANNIIDKIISSGMARYSLPGEFMFRAFYNGKIDLIQAESINDLINAETSLYSEKALNNISGALTNKLLKIKEMIIEIVTIIEHELDFNEDEIDFSDNKTYITQLKKVNNEIKTLQKSFLYSKIIRTGVRILIMGDTNVGKSSLFNRLIGHNRAIVSDQQGTTRDTIEGVFSIEGVKVTLIDSAGIMEAENNIDKEAVLMTNAEIEKSDLIILVSDTVDGFKKHYKNIDINKTIKVLSKADIYNHNKKDEYLITSSINGVGFDKLLTILSTRIRSVTGAQTQGVNLLVNQRQNDILSLCVSIINKSIKEINNNNTLDIIADLLHGTIEQLNNISSPIYRDDILKNIFAGFCVGK